MTRKLVWQANNDLPLTPIAFSTDGDDGLWADRFSGLGAVAVEPVASKGPGQSGTSVLDECGPVA